MNLKIDDYDVKSLYPNCKCLSSTQFLDYEKSPANFYTRWIVGESNGGSVSMKIGRIFSALYKNRELDFRGLLKEAKAPTRYADLFEQVIKLFPILKGGNPEFPLIAKHKGWELRATLDDFVKNQFTIIENKTGQVEWTQERTNFSDQITFQAWCHWKKYKVPPKQIILNWVDCRPKATKLVHTFKTSRSLKALKMFENRIDTVIENIEAGNFTKFIY